MAGVRVPPLAPPLAPGNGLDTLNRRLPYDRRVISEREESPALQDTAGGVSVRVRGLTHVYRSAGRSVAVLRGVDLDIEPGEYVVLSAPSGAGKTTLLSLLGGLEPVRSGSVIVGGVELKGLTGDALASYRRERVGFVFQHFGLLGTLSSQENVELACALSRETRTERRSRSQVLLDAVGLRERASHKPIELSGGERQRVAIARALANRPRLILADEPTGNLDEDASHLVIELLEKIRALGHCTLIVVTHNRSLAARAPKNYGLVDGALVQR